MDCISDNINVLDNIKSFNILWLVNFLETTKGNLSVAVCSKEYKTAFLTSANDQIKPLIVQDVIINDDGICEDSSFCLNTTCPHNENNLDKFAAVLKIPKNEINFDALVQRCKEINKYISNEFKDYTPGCLKVFERPYLAWK